MKSSLIKSFVSFSIGGYVSLIIGFFTVPIITRIITPDQYGIFSLFNLIINLCLLVVLLGFDQGFTRYYYEEKNKFLLLYTSIKYPLIFFIILLFIGVLFRNQISNFIFQQIDVHMMIALMINLFFYIINTFSFLIVRMSKQGLKYSFLQILQQVSNFIFIIIIYKIYGNSYRVLVLASVLSIIIVTLLSVIFEKEIWLRNTKEKLKINIKELFKYGYPLVITMSLSWIFQSADKIAIKIFSNLNELGLYAGAFKIIALINVVQTGFTIFWVPVAYERFSKEPENKLFFQQVFNGISFIMLLLAIVVLVSKNLIILLLGENYYLASMIMPCLVFMPIMYSISETTVLGINFSKKTKYHVIISVIVSVFNILGNLILVPKFGAKGAAISTGIAYILFFSLRTYFAKKLIDYNFKLQRLYCISILIFIYSLYLSFYNEILLNIIFGILLLVLLCILYFSEIKIIYSYLFQYYFNLKKTRR